MALSQAAPKSPKGAGACTLSLHHLESEPGELIGRDVLGRAGGLSGDELEVVTGRDVDHGAADAGRNGEPGWLGAETGEAVGVIDALCQLSFHSTTSMANQESSSAATFLPSSKLPRATTTRRCASILPSPASTCPPARRSRACSVPGWLAAPRA